MGQRNQQRRKAKAKDRARARQTHADRARQDDRPRAAGAGVGSPSGAGHGTATDGLAETVRVRTRAEELLRQAYGAVAAERGGSLDAVLGEIVQLGATPPAPAAVHQVVGEHLAGAVREAWRRGWQPLDLQAYLGGRQDRLAVELLGDVMASDLASYPSAGMDQRWFDQLTAYGASLWWPSSSSYLVARTAAAGSWALVLEASVRLIVALSWLVPLETLLPLPGTATAQAPETPRAEPVDDKVLFRVRQMLAQAESTNYEAEAETFTAAAQKLMARHSIDQAMLTAADPSRRTGGPSGRRIWIATPYVKEKILLLNAVARANRVKTVWITGLDLVTLVGYEVDMASVDTLFTSLLVQATQALNAEGKRLTIRGGSRTRSFRASFLASYATRIGERLSEVTAAETASAASDYRRSTGAELVPVLSARSAEVEDYAAELFPGVVTKSVSLARDREGWAKGRLAAERARLERGPAIEH
jgi:hypothetical protein